MKSQFLAALVTVAALAAGTHATAQTSRHVAVHAGHLLDVKSGKTLGDQILLIEDGKIVASGGAADAKVPADAIRIEQLNARALPGLIVADTHITTVPKFGYNSIELSVPREALIWAKITLIT